VKLRCKLEGQPLPQVTWYFNDQEIVSSDRYTVISDYYEFILMIPKPTLDMSGKYTVVAKNQHGVKQTSTQLAVEGRFTFLAQLVELYISAGLHVVCVSVCVSGC